MLRFATSPTAEMDIESLQVAIINYLVSRQGNDSFLVRIEDGDSKNNIEGKDTEIMQILEKFALIHESVFHQSEHLHMHQTLAIRLLEENKAFVCTCTKETLEKEKEKARLNKIVYCYSGCCENKGKEEHTKLKSNEQAFVLRLKKPTTNIVYHDLIKGDIITTSKEIDDFIILGDDGLPSRNFACACDDMLSGVTMIIRSEEHLHNTAKQIHIQNQLGFDTETTYAHLPTIHDHLSSVKWLFSEGFIPDAIINYLLLLANPKAAKKIFTLPEAIEWFKLENISKSTVKFDIDTLRFINREHLKLMNNKELSSLFGFADEDVGKLAKLYLEEVSTINELAVKIRPIFAPKVFEGTYAVQMKIIQKLIINAAMINEFDDFISYLMQKSGLKEKDFLEALRLLLTGSSHGPELSRIYPLIKSYLLEVAS